MKQSKPTAREYPGCYVSGHKYTVLCAVKQRILFGGQRFGEMLFIYLQGKK
jgi:hypothetical protein